MQMYISVAVTFNSLCGDKKQTWEGSSSQTAKIDQIKHIIRMTTLSAKNKGNPGQQI